MTDTTAIATLVSRLIAGDSRGLARAITLVENDAPESAEILSAAFPHTGRALRIGVTGAPGAGKSTLVDRLVRHFRAQQTSTGVIAVDPSSPFTGGAILGDRIRFQDLSGISDPGLYFRSMATRGSLGGLALATADVALLLEASGREIVLIETVGVGQDEIDIARLADITLLVLVPGMGDSVQSLKAGVMEIADLYVINKADRDGAHRVEQEIRALQSLNPHHPDSGRTPPVLRTVATTGQGIEALASAIGEMRTWLAQENRLPLRRTHHWQRRLEAMLRAEFLRRARFAGVTPAQLDEYAARIVAGAEDPWRLTARLAENLFNGQYAPSPRR